MDDILSNLTPPQLEAVTHKDGPMLVIAGAGSGKTRVVTRRIAYLISQGVWPSQILAMTFTNKAAREMKSRVAALVGEEPRTCGTFHSCCARFLRSDIEILQTGRTCDFTIYDTSEQQSVLKNVLKINGLKLPSGLSPRAVGELISAAKTRRRPVFDLAVERNISHPEMIANAAKLYEDKMIELNAVDFDDLLSLTADLLEQHPDVRDIYHNRFRYILIDEYQDTNHLQYELMRLLVGPTENIHVTGDPDQSIYSWRGADYHNIMSFRDDYPNARIVRLEQNYRSTQVILEAANHLIINNGNRFEKELFTDNDIGCPVYDVTTGTDFQEAEWVCRKIMTLRASGENLKDIAIFYRTNSQSARLEEEFVRCHIPYQLLGGIRFYERAEIKDLLAFLRIKVNKSDSLSLERVVSCMGYGVGPATMAKIGIVAAEKQKAIVDFLADPNFETLYPRPSPKIKAFAKFIQELVAIPLSPLSECVGKVLELSGLEERYEAEVNAEDRIGNLHELVSNAMTFAEQHDDADLNYFLQEVALVADVDAHDADADFVTL
ncbi:MAG: UvrD-helicase domain-containing protein, partial [Lentisphaeria bacterium]|nr:UvrD-helicase domain-containing protein [Lentisphaeria bacterium]